MLQINCTMCQKCNKTLTLERNEVIMLATTRCKEGKEQVRKYLVEARERAGLTQQEVAKRVGISRQYYQMVETGERQKRMNLSLASVLSGVLNIPIAEIVQRESRAAQKPEKPEEGGEEDG